MRTIAILQARMGSSRLPGKVLAEVGGRSVISHCLTRALAIHGIDGVCLATTELEADDPVAADAARHCGVVVFRGSENDVLARYAGAAKMTSADIILRITCDCPLIDPDVCGALLALRRERSASYASNNFERQWPHGLDCEAFTRNALEDADRRATDPSDREHVGPFMRRAVSAAPVHLPGPGGIAARQRWTLDYPEDLEFLRALWPYLPANRIAPWREVLAIVGDHPDVAQLNSKYST